MNSRYRIIFACVIFNLLLEYWAHGIEYFLSTWHAVPMLFLLYLTYFSMLEDLIVRYRLRDYQVLHAGFVFGLFHETLNTGSVFGSGAFFGVDPILLMLVNIGWWGFLQSVLSMYFANRVSMRDWSHPKMGKIGWALSVSFNVFVIAGALLDRAHPHGEILGYVTALIIIGAAIVLFRKMLRHKEERQFSKSRLLDSIIIVQIALCIVIGTALGSGNYLVGSLPRHEFVVAVLVLWTVLSGTMALMYRIITRKSICV